MKEPWWKRVAGRLRTGPIQPKQTIDKSTISTPVIVSGSGDIVQNFLSPIITLDLHGAPRSGGAEHADNIGVALSSDVRRGADQRIRPLGSGEKGMQGETPNFSKPLILKNAADTTHAAKQGANKQFAHTHANRQAAKEGVFGVRDSAFRRVGLDPKNREHIESVQTQIEAARSLRQPTVVGEPNSADAKRAIVTPVDALKSALLRKGLDPEEPEHVERGKNELPKVGGSRRKGSKSELVGPAWSDIKLTTGAEPVIGNVDAPNKAEAQAVKITPLEARDRAFQRAGLDPKNPQHLERVNEQIAQVITLNKQSPSAARAQLVERPRSDKGLNLV